MHILINLTGLSGTKNNITVGVIKVKTETIITLSFMKLCADIEYCSNTKL